jgi:DNA-binding CsgD family transcriptional regulator
VSLDPICLLEAAYSQPVTDEEWLRNLIDAAIPFDLGSGRSAYLFDASDPEHLRWSAIAVDGCPFDAADCERMLQAQAAGPAEVRRVMYTHGVSTAAQRLQRIVPCSVQDLVRQSADVEVGDALGVVASDPLRRGCVISLAARTKVKVPPRRLNTLRRVAAHIAAASRLRLFHRMAGNADTEAVLDSAARVQHAEGDAMAPSAREALTEAVKRIERARGRMRRVSPEAALELWQALVDGRWSLVDRIDSDGRRFLLARRNEPGAVDPRGLSLRERQVASHTAVGQSNKLIAYSLGLSTATVAAHLAAALRKLGLQSRLDLVRLLS